MAGSIATQLGENPTQWIAIAAIEAEPDSPAKKALVRALNIAKLYFKKFGKRHGS